ncbi:MAG: hypothetical protein PF439_11885 [Helicobacteraceae bacterium]|jgi:uncharacterized protein (DUF58 family)|nr:hypothetical protein [Helicobacteraceae bacterium]
MDANTMYYGGLLLIGILAFMAYRTNRILTMVLLLAIGGYFIYAHNSGITVSGELDKAADEFDKAAGYKK